MAFSTLEKVVPLKFCLYLADDILKHVGFSPLVPKLFLIAYHLWDPYDHHVPPFSRKNSIYQIYNI